jgi:mannose-6-phosphate isomerase-like protein (cupin superfamily)
VGVFKQLKNREETMSETDNQADSGEDLRGAEKKEAFHQVAESLIHNFAFSVPDIEFPNEKKKIHVKLAGTNTVRASVQILREGGENNLHYHPNMDLIYMVLKGRIRFYGPGDKVLGEYGALEGLLLPENSRYWFESVGSEEAHLLQIAGFPKGINALKRIPIDPPKHDDGGEGVWFDSESGKTLSDAEQQALERKSHSD